MRAAGNPLSGEQANALSNSVIKHEPAIVNADHRFRFQDEATIVP